MCPQLSLAIVPDVLDWGRVGFLCLYGTLGMLALATVRAAGKPGVGIIASVVYVIAIVNGQFVRPARAVWGHVSPSSSVKKSSQCMRLTAKSSVICKDL